MEHLKEFLLKIFDNDIFVIIGGITGTIWVLSIICIVYLAVNGVLPILYKLGLGLSNRKICIFSETEYSHLKNLLIDSKVFKEKNIIQIHKKDINKARNESVFLVYWKEFGSEIDTILNIKNDSTVLIIYSPHGDGRIDDENMKKIENKRNSIVVNFRGRLLNDILTSLITTAYQKR